MSDKAMWDAMAEAYISNVKRALDKVDHPRKTEMIADLKAHLEETYTRLGKSELTKEHFAGAIEEMGPPEEYAQLLADDAHPKVRTTGKLMIILAGLLLAAVLAALAVPGKSGKSAAVFIAERTWARYAAAPFFSKAAFEDVEPGMTKDEARRLVGFPLSRYRVEGRQNEVSCQYTTFAFENATRCLLYTVVFSAETGRVVRKYVARGISGGQTSYKVPGQLREKVGGLAVSRHNTGEGLKLKMNGTLYLIVGHRDGGWATLDEGVAYRTEQLRRAQEWLEGAEYEVIHLYTGKDPDKFLQLVPNGYTRSSKAVEIREYLAYFKEGVIYRQPPIYSGPDAAEWREDQRWLARKLAGLE